MKISLSIFGDPMHQAAGHTHQAAGNTHQAAIQLPNTLKFFCKRPDAY